MPTPKSTPPLKEGSGGDKTPPGGGYYRFFLKTRVKSPNVVVFSRLLSLLA